ncbi:SMI1 / KNR4 family protein, partial [Yersinia pestis PY-54]|jgi:hypothetical protein
MSE